MAIPSGTGSEVLRNAAINANNAGAARVDFGGTTGTGSVRSTGNTSGVVAVPTNVIITVLTITATAHAANDNITVSVDWQGGGTDIHIFKYLDHLIDTTFVWNDRIVLRQGDILKLYNSSTNTDWSVSFIYQDWT
jgi:hypothetical protein